MNSRASYNAEALFLSEFHRPPPTAPPIPFLILPPSFLITLLSNPDLDSSQEIMYVYNTS